MKSLQKRILFSTVIVCCTLFLQSCKTDKKQTQINTTLTEEKVEKENVIEIITENMDFQMPDTIPSGWNTFRYFNKSPQTHFFLIDKYPEGKNSEDAKKFVAPVFDNAMKLINEGKTKEGFAEFSNLPEWFSKVVFLGGSGLLSPEKTGETTLHLKPGNYMLECYVKMSNGIFHTSMGMVKDVVVSDKNSENSKPKVDVNITISSTDGIVFKDSIFAGKRTFSVLFKDQITYETFVGHDINLVKLQHNTNLKNLENWMNWADPKGLIEPAPSDVTFLGGVNDMPTGSTGYFTAKLEKGTYALISEVPNPSAKNLFKIFKVN
ncbi:hypothetical protein [Tenacibaculum caenipelagi]|uniref:Uncharacterized protein n=1 Tax=Tenacibaculum caenipelagi TaxID=1325435 RepID=A0A4R6TK25_9FLAO|nr:hypothetical protein [Tenacibaculum caenipelagi]TDQ29724.1 hypothetical protein DFQ07_0044 [Tenacibaculum caenipelagi]